MRYKRALTSREIAVYMGHRKIWEKIIDDGVYAGLVLEDDAQIVNCIELETFLHDVLFKLDYKSWSIIKLSTFNSTKTLASRFVGASELVSHKHQPKGAVGYLINPHAAKLLLKRKKIFRPVDEDFAHPWEFGLKVWSSAAYLLFEESRRLANSRIVHDRHDAYMRSGFGCTKIGLKRNILKFEKQVRAVLYKRKLVASFDGQEGWH
ncbi:glycosyltransferase family 25 protein [Ochrobactrum quorumnocens]|uniref:glycosyltransferase family 25 protein n=1 Tax=Ochrobactrum quorumnocens TaxID=271865 RepID=UPI0012FDA320|nr:glycosyltransferase family 25 protein [[Ochrobactrum] quorumnocens]